MDEFRFSHEKINENVYKVVEDDPFGQFPFLYVLLGQDKCVLIDTGTGHTNYSDYVTLFININNLPYLIINTHVHFDHIGGNHYFSEKQCLGICMGSHNKDFIAKKEVTSLAMGHPGASLKDFTVTRWLEEGDLIFLDDNNPTIENSLQILYSAGHTPDSIAIYSHRDNRLFLGDFVYPFAAVHADCMGSSMKDYENTLNRVLNFIAPFVGEEEEKEEREEEEKRLEEEEEEQRRQLEQQEKGEGEGQGQGQGQQEQQQQEQQQQQSGGNEVDQLKLAVTQSFLELIGVGVIAAASLPFDLPSFLQFCEWEVGSAVDMYLNSPEYITQAFPPLPPPSSPSPPAPSPTPSPAPSSAPSPVPSSSDSEEFSKSLRISCGHVEANMKRRMLLQFKRLLDQIKNGEKVPISITDDKYVEYSDGCLTILACLDDPWFKEMSQ